MSEIVKEAGKLAIEVDHLIEEYGVEEVYSLFLVLLNYIKEIGDDQKD